MVSYPRGAVALRQAQRPRGRCFRIISDFRENIWNISNYSLSTHAPYSASTDHRLSGCKNINIFLDIQEISAFFLILANYQWSGRGTPRNRSGRLVVVVSLGVHVMMNDVQIRQWNAIPLTFDCKDSAKFRLSEENTNKFFIPTAETLPRHHDSARNDKGACSKWQKKPTMHSAQPAISSLHYSLITLHYSKKCGLRPFPRRALFSLFNFSLNNYSPL